MLIPKKHNSADPVGWAKPGQAMVEFLIILPVMLMLLLGAVQFALIYHAKTTLNYAVFEAARAGSLNQASYKSVLEGFARGMAPLYTSFSKDAPPGDKWDMDYVSAFQKARFRILDVDVPAGRVRIERLSPRVEDFKIFADNGSEIPNDNLYYRSKKDLGNIRSIQDANLLELRITYCYKPFVPFVSGIVLKALEVSGAEPFCVGKGVPLTGTIAMRMQSTPSSRDAEEYYVSTTGK